ncbi:MAG TPA: beta-ketoacyl-ACP synthase I [Gammaproteobacteria bacterium]|nr:beta-ketoacyl-ACP synthase I [Gammaproteobacteria bacterium]HIN60317.1 beta-ketoacyl-ACP synthase I [Gammaproteobacteria bacterium]
MPRVVVTGIGIVSSVGVGCNAVSEALRKGQSGIRFSQAYADLGFRSHIHGDIEADLDQQIDRKLKRFMGDAAAYNYLAMEEAVSNSGLTQKQISDLRTGLVMGSGGGSPENIVEAADLLRQRGVKRVGPYRVTRTMASTATACLGTAYKIRGVSYAISSACATSAHCIGNAAELIQMGKQDVVFAGGGEEIHWSTSVMFDAMGALSSSYNDRPESASRAYDANRDGFVISGGAGVLVLESLSHAEARGAPVYAELVGYGATSDGHDMVQPSGDGAARCMAQALQSVDGPIDYLNAHGTSTPVGDIAELGAIRQVFGDQMPRIASTKSLTGHALGAAGVNEAVYALLMLREDFISASANIQELDSMAEGYPIVRELQVDAGLNQVMSNSFGFGGTNCTLVFRRFTG